MDEYNLAVKCFIDKVRKIEGWLVEAKIMQWIFDHDMHVWLAIQGSGAEEHY
jgi:hypothetical protein